MRRRTYIYMYESDYLCIDNGISGNMEIYPRMKIYPYMNAVETIIHLKFRKYSNFLRILNLSLLSNSQIPRTFFCPRYPSPKSSPSGRGLTLATRAQKWCFALAKLESITVPRENTFSSACWFGLMPVISPYPVRACWRSHCSPGIYSTVCGRRPRISGVNAGSR